MVHFVTTGSAWAVLSVCETAVACRTEEVLALGPRSLLWLGALQKVGHKKRGAGLLVRAETWKGPCVLAESPY